MQKKKNGTVAYIVIPKLCDIHKRRVQRALDLITGVDAAERKAAILDTVPAAKFDCRLKSGTWANVCADCRAEHAMYPDELGIGKGQELELIGSHGVNH